MRHLTERLGLTFLFFILAWLAGFVLTHGMLFLLDRLLRPVTGKEKGLVERSPEWPIYLISSLIGGFLPFRFAGFLYGSASMLWQLVVLVGSLALFAVVLPAGAPDMFEGQGDGNTRQNQYAFWAGLAFGGLAGVLVKWIGVG